MGNCEIMFPPAGAPAAVLRGLLPRTFFAGGSRVCTPQPARPFLRAIFLFSATVVLCDTWWRPLRRVAVFVLVAWSNRGWDFW